MADNVPGGPQHQASPEPDPWATTPRSNLTPPPEGGSPFARPATNPWQASEPPSGQPDAETNPYDTSGWSAPPAYPPPAAPAPAPAPGPAPESPPWQTPYAGTGYPAVGAGWAQYPGAGGPVGTMRDANPVAALFDFSFTRFATPGLVKIVYILQVVAAVGTWLMWVLGSFATAGTFGGGAATGVLVLLFGWIPVLLSIAFTRFVLEGIVALIRIHDRVTEMADASKGKPSA